VLSNLRISTRLALLIALMVGAMLVIGGHAAYALQAARGDAAAGLARAADLLAASDQVRSAEVHFRVQMQEFKNILLRGQDPGEYKRHLDNFSKRDELAVRKLEAARGTLARIGMPTADADDAARMQREITRQYLEALQLFDPTHPGSSALVDAAVRGKDRPLEEKIERAVDGVERFAQEDSARELQAADARALLAMKVLGGLVLVVVLAATLLGRVFALGISRPLQHAAEAAQRVARGDLTQDVRVRGRDETGQLLVAVDVMTRNLRQLLAELAERAHVVADASAADRPGQHGPVAAHRGTGQHAGGNGEFDGGTDIHRGAERSAPRARRVSWPPARPRSRAQGGRGRGRRSYSTMTGISARRERSPRSSA
jgi:methyl-accepting chemotaxis protein